MSFSNDLSYTELLKISYYKSFNNNIKKKIIFLTSLLYLFTTYKSALVCSLHINTNKACIPQILFLAL